jgi:hypothetical protein
MLIGGDIFLSSILSSYPLDSKRFIKIEAGSLVDKISYLKAI